MAHLWRGVIAEYADRLPAHLRERVVTLGEGGTPLVAAPYLSARTGAEVALVDRMGYLGGTGASVLDTFYGFFAPGEGERKATVAARPFVDPAKTIPKS